MGADPRPPGAPSGDGSADDAWRPDWDPQRSSAADRPGGAPRADGPGVDTPPGRRARTGAVASASLVLALVAAAVVILLSTRGQDVGSGTSPSTPTPQTPPPQTTAGGSPGASAPDAASLAATRAVVARFNTTAGADPSRQRSVLQQLVDPTQRANQLGCVAATTTVRLIPSWDAIRVAADGHLIVPTLIRIFTGSRITSTDVAIIDVTISAGQAYLPALCIS